MHVLEIKRHMQAGYIPPLQACYVWLASLINSSAVLVVVVVLVSVVGSQTKIEPHQGVPIWKSVRSGGGEESPSAAASLHCTLHGTKCSVM